MSRTVKEQYPLPFSPICKLNLRDYIPPVWFDHLRSLSLRERRPRAHPENCTLPYTFRRLEMDKSSYFVFHSLKFRNKCLRSKRPMSLDNGAGQAKEGAMQRSSFSCRQADKYSAL